MSSLPELTLQEAEVVKIGLEALRVKHSNVNKMQAQLRQVAEDNYRLMTDSNQKAADKKRQENLDYGEALKLACVINEVKLYIHFEKLLEIMLDARDSKDTQAQQRYLAILRDDRNPFEVIIPQHYQTPVEYKKEILVEAENLLATIIIRKTELQQSMLADWGSMDWQEGLTIQANQVHKAQSEKIERLEFLNVIKNPDGSNFDSTQLNKADYDPNVLQKAMNAFHEVNDALLERLHNIQPSAPELDKNVYVGADAPEAPVMISRAVIIGESVPLAPPPFNPGFFKTKSITPGSSCTREDEIEFFSKFRSAYTTIKNPFVTKAESIINDVETKINENSIIRLALKATGGVLDEIKQVEQKSVQFLKCQLQLSHLDTQHAKAEENLLKIKNDDGVLQRKSGLR